MGLTRGKGRGAVTLIGVTVVAVRHTLGTGGCSPPLDSRGSSRPQGTGTVGECGVLVSPVLPPASLGALGSRVGSVDAWEPRVLWVCGASRCCGLGSLAQRPGLACVLPLPTVLDVNDETPTFFPTVYNVSVSEDVPRDFRVVWLNCTDNDVGLNAELSYFITSAALPPPRQLRRLPGWGRRAGRGPHWPPGFSPCWSLPDSLLLAPPKGFGAPSL